MGELVGIADDPNRGDTPIVDFERGDRVDLTVERDDEPGIAVHGRKGCRGARVGPAGQIDEQSRDLVGSDHRASGRTPCGATIGQEHRVRSQPRQCTVDVTGEHGRDEFVDDAALRRGRWAWVACSHASPCPAGDLSARRLGLVHHRSDLGVGDAEHVDEEEDRAIHGAEPFQEGEEPEGERLGQLGALLRPWADHHWFREPWSDVVLTPAADGSEPVERDTGRDCREPRLRPLDRSPLNRLPAQPRLLHDILGVSQHARHPVGEAQQARPRALEGSHRLISVVRGRRHATMVVEPSIERSAACAAA